MENKRQPSPEIADLMNRVQVELDRTDRLFTRRINEILVRLRVDDTTLVRMFPVPHHGREPECKCCRLPLAERTAISCMVDAVCPKKE